MTQPSFTRISELPEQLAIFPLPAPVSALAVAAEHFRTALPQHD